MPQGTIDTTKLRIFKDGGTVDCETSSSVEVSRDIKKIVCKDNPNGIKTPGEMEWSMSVEGLFKTTAALSGKQILQDLIDGTEVNVSWTYTEGGLTISGTALVGSWTGTSSGVGEAATFSATFSGYGDLTVG